MDLSAYQGALHPALSSLQLVHIALARGSPALLSAFRHRPGSCASCPPPLLPWHPAATQPCDTHQSLVSRKAPAEFPHGTAPPPASDSSICHNPVLLVSLRRGSRHWNWTELAGRLVQQALLPGTTPAGTRSRQAAAAWASRPWPVGSLLEKPFCRSLRCPPTAAGASCSALPVPWQ